MQVNKGQSHPSASRAVLAFGKSRQVLMSLHTTFITCLHQGGSVAEWLACWTQAQKGPGSNRSRYAVG